MYKKNAAGNRDALFGDVGGSSKGSSSSKTNKNASSSKTAATGTTSSSNVNSNNVKNSQGYRPQTTTVAATATGRPSLSGAARDAKLKEAADYRDKANKCMQTGLFKQADPLAASTYFKRAADCYHLVGDVSLERLFRIESGKCNAQCGVWASAASDYTTAAELTLLDQEALTEESQRRRDAAQWHHQAAQCYLEINETAKSAASKVAASLALFGSSSDHKSNIPKDALRNMEEAVEAHVPDPLNPYRKNQ